MGLTGALQLVCGVLWRAKGCAQDCYALLLLREGSVADPNIWPQRFQAWGGDAVELDAAVLVKLAGHDVIDCADPFRGEHGIDVIQVCEKQFCGIKVALDGLQSPLLPQ